MPFQLLADAVLVLHTAVVLFVVGGLVLTLAGAWRGWRWVRRLSFRLAHLAAIGFVVVQAWWGATCPLTTLEAWLRLQGGQASYAGSFIEHWLQRLLFWDAPAWVFTGAYTGFGLAVAAAWLAVPPRRGPRAAT
jgi:polyferredoxin